MKRYLRLIMGLVLSCFILTTTGNGQETGLKATPAARSANEYSDAQKLNQTTDAQQQLTLAKDFLNKYPESEIRPVANRYIVTDYIELKDYPQALENAERALKESPDNITVMAEICRMAGETVRNKDLTYVARGEELGRKAIELIEAGKTPLEFKQDVWRPRRDPFLGTVYKSLGLISFYQNKMTDGATSFLEATRRLPKDPYCFYMLAKCRQQEINAKLTEKSSAKVAEKDTPTQASLVDDILRNLARAFVLSEDNNYQWLHAPVENELKYLLEHFKSSKTLDFYVKTVREEIDLGATHTNP